MFHLSELLLVKLYYKMSYFRNRRQLTKLILEEDCDSLSEREDDIVSCIEYEMQEEDEHPESYLIHWIARCPNHIAGRIMFQILKKVCKSGSSYHWSEIMQVAGYPMMVGAVTSQNIKLLEHAMAHVDEIYLERLLQDVDAPEVEKWYDENFVVT